MRTKKILKNILGEDYSKAKKLVSEELYVRSNVAVDTFTQEYANRIMNLNDRGEE